ncbi:MAG: hypothetical protein K2H16_07230 [Prevotella sp.]|nr:hypothetical protein [Prevotella sp.]
MKEFIYIVSEKHQSLSNVNMYASRVYTTDGFRKKYENICYKKTVTVTLVNEDGTDGNCQFTADNINELLNIISSNGEWHIIKDSGEEVPDLYKLLGRENEYQRYEHLYVFASSIN